MMIRGGRGGGGSRGGRRVGEGGEVIGEVEDNNKEAPHGQG